jgi:hypothetical protein
MAGKTNPNIEVDFKGNRYVVRKKALRKYTYGENEGQFYLNIGPTEAGQMVKQYVKTINKNYLCKVKADWFSMGNSLNVNVCMKDGSSIPKEDYQKIRDFANLFRQGRFDGMTDYYEYEHIEYKTDNGNIIEGACKYVSVDNRPKFSTTEWIVNEVKNEGRTFEETTRYVSNQKVIEKAKIILN